MLKIYFCFLANLSKKFTQKINLDILKYDGEVVTGSHIASAVLVNKMLKNSSIRIPKISEIDRIFNMNYLKLKGCYVDAGIVLRSENDNYKPSNNVIIRDLAYLIKKRGFSFSPDNPLVIPLEELDIEKDNNRLGFSFNTKEDAFIYNTEKLVSSVNGRNFYKLDKNGIPILDDNPEFFKQNKRTIYTRNEGISRMYLDEYCLSTGWADLMKSSDKGRIVLVK